MCIPKPAPREKEINLTRQWKPINQDWSHAVTPGQKPYARLEGETINDARLRGQPMSWHMDISYQPVPKDALGADVHPARPDQYFPDRYDVTVTRRDAAGSPISTETGRYANPPVNDPGAVMYRKRP